jgi:hypothetical protein
VDPRVFRLEDAVHAEARNFPDVFDSFNDVVVAPLSSALRSAIRAGKATREIRIDVDEDDLVAALVASSRARAGSASLSLVNLIFDGATSG